MITNDEVVPDKPISLSKVAIEMNMNLTRAESISIGLELSKRYTAKHGIRPVKHDQLCDGRVTPINSYMESDRGMIEEVLQWHANGRPKA